MSNQKQNTPLMELIKILSADLNYLSDSNDLLDKGAAMAFKDAIRKAKALLSKEREVIQNAREDGHLYTEPVYEGCGEMSKRLTITSEKYFNQTFNANE